MASKITMQTTVECSWKNGTTKTQMQINFPMSHIVGKEQNPFKFQVLINKHPVTIKIYTGTSKTIISQEVYGKIQQSDSNRKLPLTDVLNFFLLYIRKNY